MAKLNQVIALEKTVKAHAHHALTVAYQTLTKTPLLSGISRTYRPKDDEGEKLPSESTLVQTTVSEIFASMLTPMSKMFSLEYDKDLANTVAKADITVGDIIVLSDVPATYLLFLDKQLVDLHTFVSKLPLLDPTETWTPSDVAGTNMSTAVETVRSKKIPRNHVLAEATTEHPAQVNLWHEDVTVGYWTTIKFSGAITKKSRDEMLARVIALQEAVKIAREKANTTEVERSNVGDTILGYLFAA